MCTIVIVFTTTTGLAVKRYLCLGEAERCGQLGSLRQRQVLRPLKATVQLLKLQARVDGARLAHLFLA